MDLGFVSSILGELSFEEVIDFASRQGFHCIEMACWPDGKAQRRYAGVSHIDVHRVNKDPEYADYILDMCRITNVKISSLGYYPNYLAADEASAQAARTHLEAVIRASAVLGVNMVTTFIGRDQSKTVDENLKLMTRIWPRFIQLAESLGVKIAIENCPMLFDQDQWPGGQNLMTSPKIWRRVFELLPSKNLGINYDPSHFVWQGIDYIRPVYEFKDKIFHVHFKDIKLYPDKLADCGIMAYPLEYMSPKLPGLGDIDWGKFISALTDIGYQGHSCIEVEDRAFEGSRARIMDSLVLSRRYLRQYVI